MAGVTQLTSQATVVMVVNGAPITITINGNDAPTTAGNFVELVERGFYDGISFHRVVRQPSPFVVQAGDPQSKDPNFPANLLGTGGFVDPDTGVTRTIPLEIKSRGASQPTYNQIVSPPVQLPHNRGVISMARAQALDSGSSQFFIALADQPGLDGSYAVFGNVTSGFDVVDRIVQGDRISAARVTQGVIPTRNSAIINNVGLLNDFVNLGNAANLPLGFNDLTNGDDVFTIASPLFSLRALSGNDLVNGSSGVDAINGNQGFDTINGNDGIDYLRGGTDGDVVRGGNGNDILNGNRGNDLVDGGEGDDFVRGGQEDDTLIGGSGNDYLLGDFGRDILTGGRGADTFLLRADTNVGVTNSNAADLITDFSTGELDFIGVIGVNLSDLLYVQSGNDTQIKLNNGDILGVVQGVSASIVQGSTFVASSGDIALTRIG
jgi:peptidyl-prolyl cis-trans isomerase B (cyclophilin B)